MSLNVNYLRKGDNVFFARLCLLVCVCVRVNKITEKVMD